jgi:hypothetical protein
VAIIRGNTVVFISVFPEALGLSFRVALKFLIFPNAFKRITNHNKKTERLKLISNSNDTSATTPTSHPTLHLHPKLFKNSNKNIWQYRE